jgi:hypothetical protein
MLADRTEHEPSETRRQALRCGRVRARGTPAASLQLGPISPFIFAQASLQSGDAAAGPSGPAALAFDRLVGWPAYPCVFKMIYIAPCVFVSFGQCG